MCFAFIQRLATLAASFLLCTRAMQTGCIAHRPLCWSEMHRVDASNACTHPPVHSVIILSDDAIANWQCRERIFSTYVPSRALRRRRQYFFFFSKRRSGLTPFGEWSRGTRSVNMIKGGWSFFFLLSVVTTAGRVTRYRLLLCTRVGLMLILRLIHSYLNAIRFARINTNFVITYERKGTAEGVLKSRMRVFQNQRQKSRVYIL